MPMYTDPTTVTYLVQILSIILGPVILFVYLLPTVIAAIRNKPDKKKIILLDIFLGWTFVLWIITLVWACQKKAAQITNESIISDDYSSMQQ